MEKIKLIMDFGSNYIKIYKKNAGLVVNDESVCLVNKVRNKIELIESGQKIFETNDKIHMGESLIYPIQNGVIKNKRAFYLIMRKYISQLTPNKLFKPKFQALVSVTCGINNTEKKQFEDVLKSLNILDITFLESPVCCAALYGIYPIFIVDIGADKTELALVSEEGIVFGASLNVAGNKFSQDIKDYIEKKYKVSVNLRTIDEVKKSIASLFDYDSSNVAVSGINNITNEIVNIRITASDTKEAILNSVNTLVDTLEKMTLLIPKKLINQVYENGILICGSSAKLKGLQDYISRRIKLKILNPVNLETAAVEGASLIMDNKELISKLLNIENF